MSVTVNLPHVVKSHDKNDETGTNSDGTQQDVHNTLLFLIDKVTAKVNATLRDCRTEREELTCSVESQLRDIRTESMTVRSEQQQVQRELRALQEKLQNAVIQRSSVIVSDVERLNIQTVATSSMKLQRDTQQALSELELLKATVFHDRLTREERQQAEDAEDEALEMRLRQAEVANDELHHMALRLQAQSAQLAGALQNITHMLQQSEPRLAQQELQVKQMTERFAHMCTEHDSLAGTVESLAQSVEQHKETHDATLRKLEKLVEELERRFQQQQRKEGDRRYIDMARNYSSNAVNNINNCIEGEVNASWHHHHNPYQHHMETTSVNKATRRPLRQRLEHFYSIYNPERISFVDAIIEEYTGAEEELMATLECPQFAGDMTEEVPRVIVFDLDGTLWSPEMYELWGGGGAPFKKHRNEQNAVTDKAGTKVRLIGETREVLQTLFRDPKWRGTSLAISSTCVEPRWAMELLQLFRFTDTTGNNVPMLTLFGDLVEIYSANKASHHHTILRKLQEKNPGTKIDFSQFLFFDNQMDNISSVSNIGVTSIYCPKGMVTGVFEKGVQHWRNQRKGLSF